MGTRWSQSDKDMLREMWLCGLSSGEIARVLGRGRHAVMGAVERNGLMKRQGQGVTRPSPSGIARQAVEAALAEYGTGRGDADYDLVCRAVLALVADGRRSRRAAAIAGVHPRTMRRIGQALDQGLWPPCGGPPAAWWEEGLSRVRRDLRALAHDMARREWANAA